MNDLLGLVIIFMLVFLALGGEFDVHINDQHYRIGVHFIKGT